MLNCNWHLIDWMLNAINDGGYITKLFITVIHFQNMEIIISLNLMTIISHGILMNYQYME